MPGWCTIESDPSVFNEMMTKIGVKGVEVAEAPVLDVEELKRLGPIYGLIFLFKWKPVKREVNVVDAPNVYFAKQVENNACATQAIINIVMNCDEVALGDELAGFKEFTQALDPYTRGESLAQQEIIRTVHNSFARTQVFSFEGASGSDEDAYHFTAYIPKDGNLYELDGLQEGPILAAPNVDKSAWLEAAVPLLRERVEFVQKSDTQGNGLMFSLLAVTHDRVAHLEKQLAGAEGDQAAQLQAELQDMKDAREKGKTENIRRRHNYIPLIVSLLKTLAQKGVLEAESQAAIKRAEERAKSEKK